ncbi:hypothetical protein [Haloplanus natans]|uniref:hypothetical protein n=1 Tax=Haloplanus natans TaxID=376171 RepID=UPI0012F90BF9|nr:hypothetical protein [Haloplanus natans]
MSGTDRFWTHAGIAEVQEYNGSKQIRIPDRLFREESILELGFDVHWYYHSVTGVVLVTKNHLEEEEYEYVGSTKFSKGDSSYLCVIPAKLFDGYEGRGSPKAQPEISKKVNLPEDGWLHFMYHKGMNNEDKKSAYILTENQYSDRFDDSDLSGVPRFS